MASTAHGQVLFEPGVDTTPQSQGWSFTTLQGSALFTPGEAAIGLDSGPLPSEIAGWGRIAPISLDPEPGFTLAFQLQVLSESHTRAHRAGFSVLVVASNRRAIELGFWTDRVWAQGDEPLFESAEQATWDTTSGLIDYRLTIAEGTYVLATPEGPLLTGALRDYSAFVGILDPYETPDFLFLGDDTGSATASVRIGRVELSPSAKPSLGIEPVAGGLRLRWTAPPGWQLQSSTDPVGNAGWTRVEDPTAPDDDGDGWHMEVTPDGHARYFRLWKAPAP